MIWMDKDSDKDKDKEGEKPEGLSSIFKEIGESFLKNRKIFLWSPVDDELAEKVVRQLLFLDSKSQEDIYLFINSPGGVVSSGLAIYDCIQGIKSDVATIVSGQAASMGAVLLAAGAKGKRYAWPSARVMIHQPHITGHIFGPASDVEIQAEEMLRIRNYLNKLLSDHSGKSVEQVELDTDRDKFMNAKEAIEYGLVDKVEYIF